MAPPQRRALFIESQTLFAAFLTHLLEMAGIAVVSTEPSLRRHSLDVIRPDVLVIDANDPSVDYAAAIADARGFLPGLDVVAWAEDASPVFERLRRNGIATIPYDLDPPQAVHAIRAALQPRG